MKIIAYSILLSLLVLSCNKKEQVSPISEIIHAPPPELNLDPFYIKYVNAKGIPVISSGNVRDEALIIASDIVTCMLSIRKDILSKYIENAGMIAIIGTNELTTDIPEYKDLYEAFPGTDWNKRARGLGATLQRPVSSVGEENLLCQPSDRHHGEDILTHELAHGILNLGIRFVDPDFDEELQNAFNNARTNGLWGNTYANTNKQEYFAEGVQTWFNVNKEVDPSDGIHNFVNERDELRDYDPVLYELISRYFPEEDGKISCHLF